MLEREDIYSIKKNRGEGRKKKGNAVSIRIRLKKLEMYLCICIYNGSLYSLLSVGKKACCAKRTKMNGLCTSSSNNRSIFDRYMSKYSPPLLGEQIR